MFKECYNVKMLYTLSKFIPMFCGSIDDVTNKSTIYNIYFCID